MIWRVPVRELKMIIDILRDILLQVSFRFGDDGTISLSCADPEKVVLVNMLLTPSQQEFKCTRTIVFGFYIQSLFKIIRGAAKNEVAWLSIYNNNPDVMVVRVTNNDYQEFQVKRIADTPDLVPQVVHEYAYHLTVEANNFYAAIRDLSGVGKVVTVNVGGLDEIVFETEDALGTRASYQFHSVEIAAPLRNPYTHRYIIKYVEKFSKPGLAENIKIMLGRDLPLRCEWNMDFGCLALSVAPLG